jgi:nucleolar complex protein 2
MTTSHFFVPYISLISNKRNPHQHIQKYLSISCTENIMVKVSKATRKFNAKGGVKKALEKGTLGGKKMRNNNKQKKKLEESEVAKKQAVEKHRAEMYHQEQEEKRNQNDFTSSDNLGDLDLDSFLNTITNDSNADDGSYVDQVDNDDDDDMQYHSDSSDEDDDIYDDYESDEDVEAAEARMKSELAKLAESDPDFHEYLQKNEASLLDFQTNDDDDNDDEEIENEQDEVSNEVLVDAKVLHSIEYGAFQSHGLKPLRRLIAAYVSACHMADTKDESEMNTNGSSRKYLIESSVVFDKLMVSCLSKCHEEFRFHLLNDENHEMDVNKPINPRILSNSSRWTDLNVSIKSFMKATLHLMNEAKEAKLLVFILKSLANYIPYLSAIPNIGKVMLKTLSNLWASTSDASEEYQSVRVNAFLRIRQLALTQPFPFIELCLKTTYLSYAKSAKFANASSVSSLLPQITFMGNCVVELYSLDYASSYQHAFIYIRQLALHLRSALQKKTPESFRFVYCWQYMHCLKLWTAVLAATCGKDGDGDDEAGLMRSLIYPLVEIIFGVARLIPTTRHLPLRLHCARYLQQLAACSETFIPTTSILLEVFDLKEITMPPKRASKSSDDVRGVRLAVILKLPKDSPLRSVEQLDSCLSEVFLLLNREVDMYKYSAGCPEFYVRICQRLRKVSFLLLTI